jgi:hypothetical protein
MESHPTYQPLRGHQRFKAKQRALVLFTQGEDALPYHIIDISEGGLSFRYLGRKLKHAEIDKISLYHEYELMVESLPVTTVSDSQLRDNLVPVRRGSISFCNLTPEQQHKLATFIQQHAETSH